VRETGAPAQGTEKIAQHSGLVWSDASAIGLFALHTTAAAICGLHLGPWLVGRWFTWMPLVMGSTPVGFSANYYLEHLELVSFFPALIVGYISSRYFQRLATWAWLLPAVILLYNLLTFTDPKASVLSFDPWSRFSYFFVIERVMPTFYNLNVSDPARVAAQMTVVVPFYSGIAYSIGAFIQQHQLMKLIIEAFHREAEPEVSNPEQPRIDVIVDSNEQPAQGK
jgi:hypothetical protein